VRLRRRHIQIAVVLAISTVVLAWAGASVVGPIGRGATIPVSEVTRGRFVNRVNAQGVLSSELATQIMVPQGRRGSMYIGWIAEDGPRTSWPRP